MRFVGKLALRWERVSQRFMNWWGLKGGFYAGSREETFAGGVD